MFWQFPFLGKLSQNTSTGYSPKLLFFAIIEFTTLNNRPCLFLSVLKATFLFLFSKEGLGFFFFLGRRGRGSNFFPVF